MYSGKHSFDSANFVKPNSCFGLIKLSFRVPVNIGGPRLSNVREFVSTYSVHFSYSYNKQSTVP